MKKFLKFFAVFLSAIFLVVSFLWSKEMAVPSQSFSSPAGQGAVVHVERLSSQYYLGRLPGTEGSERAARYIARQFKKIGLEPAGEGKTYFQQVKVPKITLVKQGSRWKPLILEEDCYISDNILGFWGDDYLPSAPGFIIVSAHYDHLGMQGTDWFPGANDNASGIAVLLEIAEFYAGQERSLRFPILFAAWTGEESGLFGSSHFAATYPLEKVKGVINIDSVGNGDKNDFLVWSHLTKNELLGLFDSGAKQTGCSVEPRVLKEGAAYSSDGYSFTKKGVPAVTLLSSIWLEKNHTTDDTIEVINPQKLIKATNLVINVIEQLEN